MKVVPVLTWIAGATVSRHLLRDRSVSWGHRTRHIGSSYSLCIIGGGRVASRSLLFRRSATNYRVHFKEGM